jgi:putative tryptophan/tyrosine transport system substrate-binding protein
MGEGRVAGSRLAAISAGDLAGYGRLTSGEDARALLHEQRRELNAPASHARSVRSLRLRPYGRHKIVRRRDFIAILAAAIMGPFRASALETNRTYRIAILASFSADRLKDHFVAELSHIGLIENGNLSIDWRGMGVPATRFDAVAAQLVKARPDAIVTFGPLAGHAAQHATQSIPILAMVDDPVASGLVHSMSRPGGNTTGVGPFAAEIDAKRLQIIHDLIPTARRIGVLADPTATKSYPQVEAVARELGIELVRREVRGTDDIASAIDALAAAHVAAVEVQFGAVLAGARLLIVNQTRALRLPAIYVWPEDASDGWVAVYGPTLHESEGLLARQLLRVLNGASPADLPFVQPTKFKLVINLKAAKALGVTVPPTALAEASEVIE